VDDAGGSRAQVYQVKCARCHYPTTTHPLNGPGLQALTKVKAMPSGAPPTDERMTVVILHGRGMMPATQVDRRPARRSAGLSAHAVTDLTRKLFAASFMAPSGGLLLLLRWAWALALGAVFLLAVYNLWIFASLHQGAALVQGLLNLVFFLYLIRTEVRSKLR
jgi:hypothetical protein